MEHSSELSPTRTSGKISSSSVAIAGILLAVLLVGVFLLGYLPHLQRDRENKANAHEEATALPIVNVVPVKRSAPGTELSLPGNVQAITETPVLARAEGYLIKRYADIGDRVKAGQLLAEIDAPDLDQQVIQARASLQQAQASLTQAKASVDQSKANEALAQVTKTRNDTLVSRGVLSQQEGDQSTASYKAQSAGVSAAEANVLASQQSAGAAKANLDRLLELQGYKKVRAPFAGVITLRNIDTGALIGNGSTLLFRIAQVNILRIFVNVPQVNYGSLHVNAHAKISVQELPGRVFQGRLTRLAGALDPSTRTLLTEVQVPNADGTLLPGMYATVRFSVENSAPPLIIPGDAVVTRANGTQAAVVDPDNTAHLHTIELGRDYGLTVEVLSGLQEGQRVIVNPTDDVREGVKVQPETYREPGSPAAAKKPAGAS